MSPQITTYSGKFFDITHPDPASICIEDIAHALSLICRGNGHVTTFYSVGQHCLHIPSASIACSAPKKHRPVSCRPGWSWPPYCTMRRNVICPTCPGR